MSSWIAVLLSVPKMLAKIFAAKISPSAGKNQGLPANAVITAGDFDPDTLTPRLVVFDEFNEEIYTIELRNLVATPIGLQSQLGAPLRLADMAFDLNGDLFAYDEESDYVLDIDLAAGTFTTDLMAFELGETGALWFDAANDLHAYKRTSVAEGAGPSQSGLYRLDLSPHALTLVQSGPVLSDIDGAGLLP